MSKTSSPADTLAPELLELLGQPGPALSRGASDSQALEAALLARSMRGQLSAAAKASGVGIRELARRLSVNPGAVSRMLNSEGDVRISTVAALAHAMGRNWKAVLSEPIKASRDNPNAAVLAIRDPSSIYPVMIAADVNDFRRPSNSPVFHRQALLVSPK